MEKLTIRPEISTQWFSAVGGGMQLELAATVDGLGFQLITIVADEKDESLWVEVYAGDNVVQIPLGVLKEAIEAATGNVHSEAWYAPPETQA